jgi:serine phosphatase RsbU (regulator of sigma subunit)
MLSFAAAYFRLRLRIQLMMLVIGLVIVAVASFAYISLNRQRSIYIQEFSNATRATIEAARLGLEIGLQDENYEAINTVLRWVKENDNVEFIALADETGELMASFPDTLGFTIADFERFPREIEFSEDRYLTEGIWKTPTGGDGRLYIGFSTQYLQKAERDSIFSLVSVVLVVSLLCALSAYYLAGELTSPLEQLRVTTQKIMRNELTERASASSGSLEMRSVAEAFNQMIEKLLESQRQRLSEMEAFNKSLGERNATIEEINRKMIDSIEYAQLIQHALFPLPSEMDLPYLKFNPLFWPKDIVSGDFYWAHNNNGALYVAVVDCTGHGVPGAFMTLIGGSFLEQIVDSHKPDEELHVVLSRMNDLVRDFLKQHSDEYVTQDGMDMALLRIDPSRRTIHFAGARRPLYVMNRAGEFEEYKAVRRSIGGKNRVALVEPFTSTAIPYEPGMRLYLTTDGFADQFSPDEHKFGSKRLKESLKAYQHMEIEYLVEKLEADLFQHRGSAEQTDDITLVGIEITE